MVGDDNGNFDPDRNVTRTEMAVVMALLLDLDYEYYEASCPFWDVPTWAKGYVGACYANKTIYGYNATTYGAADGITPVQAAAMMMRALGYFQYTEDTKDGFELSTVRQGSEIGIFEGVGSSATAPMTRNQVAKMALNALKSEMVTFTGTPGTEYTSSSGEKLTIGYRAEYTPRTSTEVKYNAIEGRTSDVASDANHKGQYYIQLGEQLYNGDLKLRNHTLDDFGRPSRTWEYKGSEIGTYAKKELLAHEAYTVGVTGRQVYDLLGQNTIRENKLAAYVDGSDNLANLDRKDLVRSNENDLNATGRGVLTEIYLDNDLEKITIVSINTWLAQANSDYNENAETVSLTVYNNNSGTTKLVDKEKVPGIVDMKKDDWCLVNWADETANKVVVKMLDVEIMEDVTVTGFASSEEDHNNYSDPDDPNRRVSEITTAEATYKNNKNAYYKENTLNNYSEDKLVDKTYTIYMDQYGYFIGAELYSGKDQYVFITGYDRPTSAIGVSTASATVAGVPAYKNTNGTGNSYGEDASVYITVKMDTVDKAGTRYTDSANPKGVSEISGVYTGVQNVKLIYENSSWATAVYDENHYIIAAVILGEAEGVVDNYAYICGGAKNEKIVKDDNGDNVHYWDVDVIMNGELVTKTIKSKYANTTGNLVPYTVQELVLDADGYVTKINSLENPLDTTGSETVDGVRKDEVYSNFDYNNNSSAVKPNSADLIDYSVYDINVGKNGYGHSLTGSTACTWDSNCRYTNLSVQGRTIVYTANGNELGGGAANDLGLPYTSDAKAVVYQQIGNKMKYVNYDSVEAAFRALYDANTAVANGTNMKQFSGRVVAVLDSDGRAEWVFFHDYRPAPNNDPIYDDTTTIDGVKKGANVGIKEVNDLLADGKNVIIEGSWKPYDLTAANNVVYLPANRTLAVMGDFNCYQNNNAQNIQIISTASGLADAGKIIVGDANGSAIAKNATFTVMNQDIDFEVQARKMVIGQSDSVMTRAINKKVTVAGNLQINNGLTINANAVLEAHDITQQYGSATINVYSSLNVTDLNATTVNVLYPSTLNVNGTVGGSVVTAVNVGDSTHNGRAVINTVGASGTVTINNASAATAATTVTTNNGTVDVKCGSAEITTNKNVAKTTVATGTLSVSNNTAGTVTGFAGSTATVKTNNGGTVEGDVKTETATSGTIKGGTVTNVEKGAKIDVASNATVTVTGKLDTAKVAVPSDGNLVLKTGMTIGENSNVTASGKKVTGTVTADKTVTNKTTESDPITVTGSEATTEVKSPFASQPQTDTELQNALGDWASMSSVISFTTTSYTDGSGDGSADSKPAGTVTLSGTITPITEETMSINNIKTYTGDAISTWEDFVAPSSTQKPGGYDLLREDGTLKQFGFVFVQMEDGDWYVMMMVKDPDADHAGWWMERRPSSGEISYHQTRSLNFGINGATSYYTVDLSGLR